MQIIQWLHKVAVLTHEPPKGSPIVNTSTPNNKKETCTAKSKEILTSNHLGTNRRQKRVRNISLGCENFNLFTILRRRDIAKTCFYSTRVNTMEMMKKEDIARGLRYTNNKMTDLAANHVGNTKVLPLTDSAISPSTSQCGKDEKGYQRAKSDKSKTLSKMKELLRWAAAAKSEKGGKYISRKVLQFRNRGALKSVPDDEVLSNDSPKISFRWELESCSTTSSVYSAISKASSKRIIIDQNNNTTPSTTTRKSGNWITTDSDFVVLEL